MPVVLVVLGAAAIVYGAAFHVLPVHPAPATPSEPTAAPAPEPFAAPSPESFMGLPGRAAPPKVQEPIAEKAPAPIMESEPALVREVSVGGVTLSEAGDIRRTYSGAPPAQCPT